MCLIGIRTDDRVEVIVSCFVDALNWELLGEIDSDNYGEGYDLLYKGMEVRLYDDERSDEALHQIYAGIFQDWEQAMEVAVAKMTGKVFLKFEVDRYDEFPSALRELAVVEIKKRLIECGYESAHISTDIT